jgi:hypothetical protein
MVTPSGPRGNARGANSDDNRTRESRPNAQANGQAGSEWPEIIPLGEVPAAPPFPVEVLPGWQRGWVKAVAQAYQVPTDLPAVLGLAVAGAALATRYRVRVRDNWTEPTNLLAVVALLPGERKSQVFAEALRPVVLHEREERARLAAEIASAGTEHRILEQQLQRAERAAANAEPADRDRLRAEAFALAVRLGGHQVPAAPQLWCDDATPEALVTLLAQQGGRLLVASPEGTPFEVIKGRYQEKGKQPNFDPYLKGHAGDALRTNRASKDRPPEIVDCPALSAALTVQPDVLRALAEQASMKARGLLARWLYSLPESRVGRRQVAAPGVPETVALDYLHSMLALWRLKGTTDEAGLPAPHWLHFSPGADQALRQLERWLEPRLGEGGELFYLAGWANKLAGAAARVAAILHVCEAAVTSGERQAEVAEPTARAAIRLARDYLLPQARAAFSLMGANARVEDAKQVLRWVRANCANSAKRIQGGARLSKRAIFEGCKGRWPTVTQLVPILDLLAQHHYLVPLPEKEHPGRGRKPSPEYLINPRGLRDQAAGVPESDSHNSQNSAEGVGMC